MGIENSEGAENKITNEAEPYGEPTENDALKERDRIIGEQNGQIEDLNIRLFDLKTRLALLLAGVAREKLDESAALAAGICKSGKSPEEAAAEIVGEYPHLKAVRREIPQFSASGMCADEGFSAIRKIFAKR